VIRDPRSKDEIRREIPRERSVEIIDPRRWTSRTETAEVEASASVEIAHSSGTVETFMVLCVAVPVRCAL